MIFFISGGGIGLLLMAYVAYWKGFVFLGTDSGVTLQYCHVWEAIVTFYALLPYFVCLILIVDSYRRLMKVKVAEFTISKSKIGVHIVAILFLTIIETCFSTMLVGVSKWRANKS